MLVMIAGLALLHSLEPDSKAHFLENVHPLSFAIGMKSIIVL